MPSNVDLGRKLEKVVSKLVSRGRYSSKSEMIREGVCPVGGARSISGRWTRRSCFPRVEHARKQSA
jgi:Arc/MetJ-type ribon-helix-helix transcriptional regulator